MERSGNIVATYAPRVWFKAIGERVYGYTPLTTNILCQYILTGQPTPPGFPPGFLSVEQLPSPISDYTGYCRVPEIMLEYITPEDLQQTRTVAEYDGDTPTPEGATQHLTPDGTLVYLRASDVGPGFRCDYLKIPPGLILFRGIDGALLFVLKRDEEAVSVGRFIIAQRDAELRRDGWSAEQIDHARRAVIHRRLDLLARITPALNNGTSYATTSLDVMARETGALLMAIFDEFIWQPAATLTELRDAVADVAREIGDPGLSDDVEYYIAELARNQGWNNDGEIMGGFRHLRVMTWWEREHGVAITPRSAVGRSDEPGGVANGTIPIASSGVQLEPEPPTAAARRQWRSVMPDDPDHLTVCNSAVYQVMREIIPNKRAFEADPADPDRPYPYARMNKRGVEGSLMMIHPADETGAQKTSDHVARVWAHREQLTDLDADILDILVSHWINHADDDGQAVITLKHVLDYRGVRPKLDSDGYSRGYRNEEKDRHLEALKRAFSWWLVIKEERSVSRRRRERDTVEYRVFVQEGRAKREEWVQGRLWDTTAAQPNITAYAVHYRIGTPIRKYLSTWSRETALLSAQAVRYNYHNEVWEKRLCRYLSWQWRVNAKHSETVRRFRVSTLLDAILHTPPKPRQDAPSDGSDTQEEQAEQKKTRAERHRGETRAKLEKALDRLQADKVIATWQYDPDTWDDAEDSTDVRGGFARWSGEDGRGAVIIIEAPDDVRTQYQRIGKAAAKLLPANRTDSAPKLAGRIRAKMAERGISSELRAAEIIGISQPTLNRILKGSTPSKSNRAKLERWLEG